ncbi:MAG: hypothetical protein KGL39_03345 [Patescibacteria group bacterium]|nr:hypothetical protein [Patescibacteria group bacterium]
MSSTILGGVPLIDPAQLGKAATADSAFQALDSMLNGVLSLNAAALTSPYTIPYQAGDEPAVTKTALRFFLLQVTGALTAPWTAYMPNDGTQRGFVVQNLTTGGENVTVMCTGKTGVIVPAGETVYCFLDGTDVVQLPIAAPPGSQPWDAGNFIDGQPSAGQTIMRFITSRTITFPANFADNQMKCGTAALANAVFNINKNGASVGQATIAAGQTLATWTSTGGLSCVFNSGDVCTFLAPNPQDANMADLEWVFSGTR